jgi:N4-(beta-N-acetylglucosaminyl)-L-asparaginase
MNQAMSRRTFMVASGIGALAGPGVVAQSQTPPSLAQKRSAKPVVVASGNGNKSKDAAGLTCVAKAFQLITAGVDVLDAIIAGVNIIELDPEEDSVGYGGLPNADGVVQLDASVMHGPLKRAGAVACLEGVRTPSLIAKKVMEETDHHLLAGQDAQRFARNMGFKIEDDLNTDKSRKLWLEWKRRTDPSHYPNLKERAEAQRSAGQAMVAEGLIDSEHFHGTVNCVGVNAKGEVAGVTSTSGLAWKIPGRVSDSAILGAGLYVDGEVGAAGSTGRGEATLFSVGSCLIIEAMRSGMSPKDAGMAALKRIVANTVERRLLNGRGKPSFNVRFYAVNATGDFAGVSLYEYSEQGELAKFAICTADGPRTVPAAALLPGRPND